MSMPSLPLLLYILIIYNMSNMSRDRFPPDAIFHKRSGLRDGSFHTLNAKHNSRRKFYSIFIQTAEQFFLHFDENHAIL